MELLQEEIYDHTSDSAQESFRNQQYQRSSMQRSVIVDRLRRIRISEWQQFTE